MLETTSVPCLHPHRRHAHRSPAYWMPGPEGDWLIELDRMITKRNITVRALIVEGSNLSPLTMKRFQAPKAIVVLVWAPKAMLVLVRAPEAVILFAWASGQDTHLCQDPHLCQDQHLCHFTTTTTPGSPIPPLPPPLPCSHYTLGVAPVARRTTR